MFGLVCAQTGLASLRLFSSDFAKMADTRKALVELQNKQGEPKAYQPTLIRKSYIFYTSFCPPTYLVLGRILEELLCNLSNQ